MNEHEQIHNSVTLFCSTVFHPLFSFSWQQIDVRFFIFVNNKNKMKSSLDVPIFCSECSGSQAQLTVCSGAQENDFKLLRYVKHTM